MNASHRCGCLGSKFSIGRCQNSLCFKLFAVIFICLILCLTCYFVETRRRSSNDPDSLIRKKAQDKREESNSEKLIQLIKSKKNKYNLKVLNELAEEGSGFYTEFTDFLEKQVNRITESDTTTSSEGQDEYVETTIKRKVDLPAMLDINLETSTKKAEEIERIQERRVEQIPEYSETKKHEEFDWAHTIPIVEFDDITGEYAKMHALSEGKKERLNRNWIGKNFEDLKAQNDDPDKDIIIESSEIPYENLSSVKNEQSDDRYFSNERNMERNEKLRNEKSLPDNFFDNLSDLQQKQTNNDYYGDDDASDLDQDNSNNNKIDTELSTLLDSIFGSMSNLLKPTVQQIKPTQYTLSNHPLILPRTSQQLTRQSNSLPPHARTITSRDSSKRSTLLDPWQEKPPTPPTFKPLLAPPKTIFASFATQRTPIQLPQPQRNNWLENFNAMNYNTILEKLFKNNKR